MMQIPKRITQLGTALGLILLLGFQHMAPAKDPPAKPADPVPVFQNLSLDAARMKAKTDGKVVMVDFWAVWCGPCRMLAGTTFTDDKVLAWLKDRTVSIKIEVDEGEDLAGKYTITNIPAVLFLKPDGSEIGRIVGYKGPEEFLKAADKILAGK